MKSLKMSVKLNAELKKVYDAWMSSKDHGEMTDSPAKIENKVGGKFTAWDEYIFGTTVELVSNKKIVQKWRTTEFPDDAPDSDLKITLEPGHLGGVSKKTTKLTLVHTNIPEGQKKQYEESWTNFYFEPMKKYFNK